MPTNPTSPDASSHSSLSLSVEQRLGNFQLQASLTLPASGVTGIFGISGSGKTSLLRIIAGLDTPDVGKLQLGDQVLLDTQQRQNVPAHQRRIGVVFQEARLFPHYRVRGNLTYGMPKRAAHRFDEIVELLGIGHLLERIPGTLSGGEARRVAIGRALLSDPQLLLMDEPLSGLDGPRKQELLRFIARLTRQVQIPVIYVSHDPEEISAIADHLVLMKAGRVIASDPLHDLLQRFDLTEELGGFDAASIIEGQVVEHDDVYQLTHLALDKCHQLIIPGISAPIGSRLRVRIFARDIALALSPTKDTSYRNQLAATIKKMETLPTSPHSVELLLSLGSIHLRSRLTRKSSDEMKLAVGKQVTALVRSVSILHY
ncbi:MAG: molybdenum ABC transporter ATP-binding protein [Gammaproteobacteria bacterium]|uniref:molybdenum ABC transporter ATP-binding protein n=1 Tax=Vreelandella venusta TaxID=44935 RepID=UPI0022863DBB|nr:molybdenum ABC transporter ATP-binding protein [Halomonas venusta]MBR9925795.1 molybdenum ABC transporter ATP-binding protein [Gammaproteobacteria bacterium]MDX1713742.1 molybdenum ABC transporter ATP-binding protein [Halomonas venusta]WAM51905.1 molybdenum ABC transporter ATP-binding protein [Halomonas venusta]